MIEVFDLKRNRTGTSENIMSAKPERKFTVGHVNLEPGQIVGEHSTQNHEEIIYVISGEGIMFTPDSKVPMREGTMIHVQSPQIHNVRNSSKEILDYVFIVA